jgi:hypothetical protein
MIKKLLLISIFICFLFTAFYAFNNYIYNQKQSRPNQIEPYMATLSGEYVCLPHRDQSGPQTLECALGIKTSTGEYYALDLNKISPSTLDFATGDNLKVTGTVTPIERLSANHWQKYQVTGILSVDSVEKI